MNEKRLKKHQPNAIYGPYLNHDSNTSTGKREVSKTIGKL